MALYETRTRRAPRLAYIVSRFPKVTETFVLNELIALERAGACVELFPLLRERPAVQHPEARDWARRARYQPFLSAAILRAQLFYLRRDPRRYLRVLWTVLRETWGSANFFVGAIGIFPKTVRFAYEMQQGGIDHIHAHFANHPAAAAFIIHELTGIPYSFTAHGSDLHVERRMLKTKVEAAAFAVTISSYNRELILRECGEQFRPRIQVVHCGIDPAAFPPRAETHAVTSESLRIVCVGSLEEVKGHHYLVEACRLVRAHGISVQAVLVGDGPLRRALETQVAAAGLESCIRLAGWLPRPQVAALLRDADVAVLASCRTRAGKREGIPVALMEAMASGLPVIASALSGIPELVEDGVTGLLVPPRDAAALAAALERLAADPVLRRDLGTRACAKVQHEFNLEQNTRKLLTLFEAATAHRALQDLRSAASVAGA
ncbi:MAG TPA: glycosyltransferase [Longimicrobiales bacterium]|nr:glycosyltransferase [Longimicrobiales bacterium]